MSAFVSGIYWGFLGCWSYLVFFLFGHDGFEGGERREREGGGEERERDHTILIQSIGLAYNLVHSQHSLCTPLS